MKKKKLSNKLDNGAIAKLASLTSDAINDYKKRQKQLIHDHISKSNIVITTALIPGKPAPILIPKPMVESMKPGSIIMD